MCRNVSTGPCDTHEEGRKEETREGSLEEVPSQLKRRQNKGCGQYATPSPKEN